MTHHHEEQHAEEVWEDDGGKAKHVGDPATEKATQAEKDEAARQASAKLGGEMEPGRRDQREYQRRIDGG